MKNQKASIFLLALLLFTTSKLFSQPPCSNYTYDPFQIDTYQQLVCSVQDVSSHLVQNSGSTACVSNICQTNSKTTTVTYNAPSQFTGVIFQVTGGVFSEGDAGFIPNYCKNDIKTYRPNGASSISAKINWTTPGTHYIEVFGYITTGTIPDKLVHYGYITVNVADCIVPQAPTDIMLSSPAYCGWNLYTTASTGAESYTWSGAGYGTYTSNSQGPFVGGNRTVQVCVSAGNQYGSSPTFCKNMYIPSSYGSGCSSYSEDKVEAKVKKEELPKILNEIESISINNPVNHELKIRFSDLRKYQIEIYNNYGVRVQSTSSINSKFKNITTSNLANGIYHIIILDDKRKVVQKKLIVQH